MPDFDAKAASAPSYSSGQSGAAHQNDKFKQYKDLFTSYRLVIVPLRALK
jgi:hypothetical protein